MTMRLHLLCSASTASVSAVAFASADEPLDPRGKESLAGFSSRFRACDILLCSPALCARQTADGLIPAATVEPLLRDCDFGRWAGRSLTDVEANEPEAVADWLGNPRAAPHGGESFADVTRRVGGWMDQMLIKSGSVLAITHALVIRAAIAHVVGAGPEAFRHIDVGPLTRARLSGGGGRWTLGSLIPVQDAR
ncbi:histidine phosphatase family protein [Bradyrhizobium sp.]|uniref:histidine phosphatase family protein n=1 Tax=Bradyrhizobium sp. TaxID=376 RepID=UPI00260A9DBC|nr:histidine phosphatase family protein [Bradyrhizobium sp.]